uniref:Uncharacterized protein AlNc14C260G9801 n=1 Tax=Albugo laibachii Nc14 TaxID=890382 RepID=F0WTX8_9STRA|nr:conserved hypothetical protein [Albugo laibachii Nc14]|eukprot:CCA24822.1 conserved hypothetical protein [Albugo laibachii Nc14]
MTKSALVHVERLMRNRLNRVGLTRVTRRHLSTPTVEDKVVKTSFARKYIWVPVGLVLGIPTVISAAFVYNLKFDPEFYHHFERKYPDLIERINKYVSIDDGYLQLKKREDIGTVTPAFDIQNEDVDIIVKFQSRKKVRLRVSGTMSQSDIGQLARKEANTTSDDPIVSIDFDEENVNETALNKLPRKDISSVWQPHGQFSWGSLKNVEKKKPSETDLRKEIKKLTFQQKALEESKLTTGRDIDDIDEEVKSIETRKKDLTRALPHSGFAKFFSWWS